MCNAKTNPKMKITTFLLSFYLVFNCSIAFAHKDRIERPKTYQFIFHDKDTIKLNNPSEAILKKYNEDIISGKRKLLNVLLLFATGEVINMKNNGKEWTEMNISNGTIAIDVPNAILKKISQIHFTTIALLWNSDNDKSFDSNYFYIQFDIGREKSFNHYPYLELNFTNSKYKKAEIWRQVSDKAKQRSDF
jgi:uncharacterized protein YccT (UPF0319 family)